MLGLVINLSLYDLDQPDEPAVQSEILDSITTALDFNADNFVVWWSEVEQHAAYNAVAARNARPTASEHWDATVIQPALHER